MCNIILATPSGVEKYKSPLSNLAGQITLAREALPALQNTATVGPIIDQQERGQGAMCGIQITVESSLNCEN